jgi:Raf kinase inhibitor-like YbhB/YbcL family protein
VIIPTRFSRRLRALLVTFLLQGALASGAGSAVPAERLSVSSASFAEGALIPNAYVYHGCAPGALNRSPALFWRGAPARTKSFALTLYDPDAPTGHGFWHWVLFNIPASIHRIAAGGGDPRSAQAPRHAIAGRSDFGATEYDGPCPPPGSKPHRYVFTVRALDVARVTGGSGAMTGPALVAAFDGHVLAEGTLTARFGR